MSLASHSQILSRVEQRSIIPHSNIITNETKGLYTCHSQVNHKYNKKMEQRFNAQV